MPKETYVLSSFEKGIITDSTGRDIENESMVISENIDFYRNTHYFRTKSQLQKPVIRLS